MSPTDPSKSLVNLLKRLASQHGQLLHQPITAWLGTKLVPAVVATPASAEAQGLPAVEAPATVLPPGAGDEDPLLMELVYSSLLWDATTTQARNMMRRLSDTFVDLNELRVCLSDELAEVLGDRYPRSLERSQRLRASLQDIYKREHGMRLSHLTTANKRDIRGYLDSLDGIPPFVAARVFLVCFGGHAVPCDSRLVDLLADEGAIDSQLQDPAEVGAWLERQIRAADSMSSALLLQAWSDEKGSAPKREKRPLDPYGLEEAVREARAAVRAGEPIKPRPSVKPDAKSDAKPEAKSDTKSDPKAAARAVKAAKPASKPAKASKSKGR